MTQTTALATTDGTELAMLSRVEVEEKLFELAQRKAQIYAKSSLVPKEYQNNVGNVLIAENMAQRMGADTLMVMQNLYVVHGKPGWSAAFLIASFNSCGRFSAIKYRFRGEEHTPEWGCQAYCTELGTGEEIEGTWVTWQMATTEGWVNKAGSKWKSMPSQMFRYRAATFLIRATAPEIGMGLLTKDELEDMSADMRSQVADFMAAKTQDTASELRHRLEAAKAQDDAVEAEIIDESTPIETDIPQDPAPDYVEEGIHEPPVDEDPLESLRANVEAALSELPKSRQRDLIAGRPVVAKMDEQELTELLKAIQAE